MLIDVAERVKTKMYMIDNTEISDYLNPEEIGQEIFNFSEEMQDEYIQEVKAARIAERVKIDEDYIVRKAKIHKLKRIQVLKCLFL